jgi:hypothetical protein
MLVAGVGRDIPQTPRWRAGSDSRTTAFVLTACLISLEMTGNNIDAIVRYSSAPSIRDETEQLTSVRNISSSVHGALNSLGKGVISSTNLVYSKGATSIMSAVSGSILLISHKSFRRCWTYLNILNFLNLHESPPTFPTH